MNLTVKDLGEQGLLPILQKYCPAEIIGDDGAILSLKDGYSLVVTTAILPPLPKMWAGERRRLIYPI